MSKRSVKIIYEGSIKPYTRIRSAGKKGGILVYNTPEYNKFLNNFALITRSQFKNKKPFKHCKIHLTLYGRMARKTDIDNYEKAIFDGLQRAGVLINDRYVWEVHKKKIVAKKDKAEIMIKEVDNGLYTV